MTSARSAANSASSGRVFAQKHLPAAALPAQMIHVINIADEIGIFKAHHVPVFVCAVIEALRPSRRRPESFQYLEWTRGKWRCGLSGGQLDPAIRPHRREYQRTVLRRAGFLQALHGTPYPGGSHAGIVFAFARDELCQRESAAPQQIVPHRRRPRDHGSRSQPATAPPRPLPLSLLRGMQIHGAHSLPVCRRAAGYTARKPRACSIACWDVPFCPMAMAIRPRRQFRGFFVPGTDPAAARSTALCAGPYRPPATEDLPNARPLTGGSVTSKS